MAERGYNWPSMLFYAATATAVVVTLCAVGAFMADRRDLASTLMAAFLACFSLVKFAVGARALRELSQVPAGGEDPRELFVTNGRFWLWVVMKNVAALIALAAAIIILVHGPGHLI